MPLSPGKLKMWKVIRVLAPAIFFIGFVSLLGFGGYLATHRPSRRMLHMDSWFGSNSSEVVFILRSGKIGFIIIYLG
jgi:hypothetical protein